MTTTLCLLICDDHGLAFRQRPGGAADKFRINTSADQVSDERPHVRHAGVSAIICAQRFTPFIAVVWSRLPNIRPICGRL